jgi:hypothetical protein
VTTKKKDTLTGKFVHTFSDESKIEKFPGWRVINQQGWIKEVVKTDNFGVPTAYVVQWFEWGFGEPSSQSIETVDKMIAETWSFYETEDQWRYQSDRQFEMQRIDRGERKEIHS